LLLRSRVLLTTNKNTRRGWALKYEIRVGQTFGQARKFMLTTAQ
jgi:hypothetical protein